MFFTTDNIKNGSNYRNHPCFKKPRSCRLFALAPRPEIGYASDSFGPQKLEELHQADRHAQSRSARLYSSARITKLGFSKAIKQNKLGQCNKRQEQVAKSSFKHSPCWSKQSFCLRSLLLHLPFTLPIINMRRTNETRHLEHERCPVQAVCT